MNITTDTEARPDTKEHDPAPTLVRAIIGNAERRLLTDAACRPDGQFVVSKRGQIPTVIGLLTTTFPNANVLIVTRNREQIRVLHRRLSRWSWLEKEVHLNMDSAPGNRPFVLLASTASFACVNDFDWDVVIFVGAETAISKDSHSRATRLKDCVFRRRVPVRMYCVGMEQRLSQREQGLLREVCGEVTWTAPDERGCRPAPVRVLLADSSHIHLSEKSTSALQSKRQTIWHNQLRNQVIVECAQAFATLNTTALWNHGIPADAITWPETPEDWSVAVLVESPEHARALERLLPDFPIASHVPDKAGIIEDVHGRKCIVTEAAAADGISTDVLVRATGTDAPLLAEGFPKPKKTDECYEAVLVDFKDDFHARAAKETTRREGDYQSRGWTIDAPTTQRSPSNSMASQTDGVSDRNHGTKEGRR